MKPLALNYLSYPPSADRLSFALGGADVKTKNPYPPLVAADLSVAYSRARQTYRCLDHASTAQSINACLNSDRDFTTLIKACQDPTVTPFLAVSACQTSSIQAPTAIDACVGVSMLGFDALHQAAGFNTSATKARQVCTPVWSVGAALSGHCKDSITSDVVPLLVYTNSTNHKNLPVHHCQYSPILPAVPVPCRYYPIPVILKPFACPPPPPSNRLPLPIHSIKTNQPSYALNLAFACRVNQINSTAPQPPNTPIITPSKTGYVMHHTIQATIANNTVNPIAFSIQTDMSGFCWQGQIELSLDDYNVIKDFEHPIIKVVINQTAFVLIGEDTTINQSFGKHSISLSGRSVSAMLAQEYAQIRHIQDANLYASQIVSAQLENNRIQANFGITDYLVPKGAYTATGKTPIAVLDDIATACGGFLYSDPVLSVIHLLPRYKKPAWQIKSAAADVILSKDLIKSLSTTHQKRPLYNTITLVGQAQGGIVYRLDMGQDKDAPVANHLLYTEQACIVQAGTALLSDSGDKSKIILTTLLSYTVPLAKLGDIWQIGADGIKAVVVSVAVSASVSAGVVSVWQTVGLIADKEQQ